MSSVGQRQQEGHDDDDEAQRQREEDEEEEERTGEGRGPLGQVPFPGVLGRIHLRALALACSAAAEHKGAHLGDALLGLETRDRRQKKLL